MGKYGEGVGQANYPHCSCGDGVRAAFGYPKLGAFPCGGTVLGWEPIYGGVGMGGGNAPGIPTAVALRFPIFCYLRAL